MLHQLTQTFGHPDQQPVADRMTQRVVDRFEAIEVDHHEARPVVVARGRVERTRKRLVDH